MLLISMGNCCQPEMANRNDDINMVRGRSTDTAPGDKEPSKITPVAQFGQSRKESLQNNAGPGSQGRVSGNKRKDSQSNLQESNHMLQRKEKKMGNIIQIEKEVAVENIEKIERGLDPKTIEFLNRAFNKHFVLANLTEEEK